MTNLELLTTHDVSNLTGASVSTVTRWVNEGKLKPVHKGRGLRGAFMFLKEDVVALQEKLPDMGWLPPTKDPQNEQDD